MSLLMEALRKAEEAKRRMQQEEQAAAVGRDPREVADVPSQSAPRSATNSPFSLEDREDLTPEYIRDNFTATQSPPEPPREEPAAVEPPAPEPEYTPDPEPAARNLARRKQRAAAASVFEAKQNPAKNRKALTILVIVMVLMIPAGGGVLWYLQSAQSDSMFNPALANYDLSSRNLDAAPASTAAPQGTATTAVATGATAVTAPETAAPQQNAEGVVEAASTAVATTEEAPAQPGGEITAETAAAPAPEPAITATPPVPLPNTVATAAPAEAVAAPEVTEPVGVLEISRTPRGTREVNPDLVAAYESLQAGDLATAARLYQQLLDVLPNSRDAMLGLALIHQRQNNPFSARQLYDRLLQLNPRDALAQTGLLQTMQSTDPAEHESALKRLISQYPDVAQLTLALGNLYADQQRWSEAQGAYYNALLAASRSTGGPVNPVYAFNLAISLEQLNQPKAALEYYRQAQALAGVVTPDFDLEQVNSRIASLEQAQP
jgi:tetratricopeptide (TPR) repeat protein